MSSVFHSYDIRGIWQQTIDPLFAYKLGVAFVLQYKPKHIVVGYDERIGSNLLHEALCDAFADHGVKVISIGLCTTPMVWHAVNYHKADGGIMVTASHNPKEYVGFKLCERGAIPIGYDSGLKQLEKRMESLHTQIPSKPAHISSTESAHYKLFAKSLAPFVADQAPLRIVADCSNSAVAPILVSLFAGTRHELILLNEKADGNFPAHEPNPMIASTTKQLSEQVVSEEADFGVIFDGDADRVLFVDEQGRRISPDVITALIGRQLVERKHLALQLTKTTRAASVAALQKDIPVVLADLRSSKAVSQIISRSGGKLFLTRVGRPHIIEQLHKTKALFAGELSGHYYYADFFGCDDGVRTLLEMTQLLATSQRKLSELARECQLYVSCGETNFFVKEPMVVMDAIAQEYDVRKPMQVSKLDGISVHFDTFWFNVRASNTEPLLRVNMEADTQSILDAEFAKLVSIIKRFM